MTARPADVPAPGPVYRFAANIAFGIFRVQGWQWQVDGLEHVPDRGGAVIAANHTSFWDFFTVGRPVYRGMGRPIRILAKESLFRAPVFGWLMKRAHHIPVHRGGGAEALRSAVEALRAGELVLVLPEQTVSESFDLLPFKSGAARMAGLAEVPLVPAVSWGTQRFHTVGRRPSLHRGLPVSVRFGAPLHPSPEDDVTAVTEQLRGRVQGLLDQVIPAYPDRPVAGDDWWHPARLGGSAPAHDEVLAKAAEMEREWRRKRSA